MTARSVSDLAAAAQGMQMDVWMRSEKPDGEVTFFPMRLDNVLSQESLDALDELVARLEAAEAENDRLQTIHSDDCRIHECQPPWVCSCGTARAEAAEAQVAALTRERDDALKARNLWEYAAEERALVIHRSDARAEAAEAALADEREAHAAEIGWDGATTAKERAEAALADTRRALDDAFIVFDGTKWAAAYAHLYDAARLAAAGGGTCTLHVGCTAATHMEECPAQVGQEQ